jgi:Citrate synthase, C-terminal domain
VLASLFDAMLGSRSQGRAIHQRLAAAWGRPQAEDIIRRTLVLLADHELNASTFATRVTASTGASLAASILSGLATFAGPLHGGTHAELQALAESARKSGADEAVRDWLSQGRLVPAFGHPLYADRDIRAVALLKRFDSPSLYTRLRAAAERITGEQPNIYFALGALAAAYDLPVYAPLTLFAMARSVGWVAHAHDSASVMGTDNCVGLPVVGAACNRQPDSPARPLCWTAAPNSYIAAAMNFRKPWLSLCFLKTSSVGEISIVPAPHRLPSSNPAPFWSTSIDVNLQAKGAHT